MTARDDQGTDDVLLRRYAEGDREAARELTRRLLPRVFGQALRMLGDHAEAEDVAQEAMLRLWRMAPGWRPGEARVTTWLFRVVANLCTDRLRRRRTTGLEAASGMASADPAAHEEMMNGARRDALRQALADLPERQRLAIVLRHFEGLDNGEIAEALGTSVEAVESLLARGRRTLAGRLRPRQKELGYVEE